MRARGDESSLLLAQGDVDSEHAFDETASFCGARAEAYFSAKDAMPDRALGRVVGGFDARDAHEGPKRGLVLEQFLAGP